MAYMRGRRLRLHIQVPPKNEEFTIRDLVNAAIEFLPKGSSLVQDCFVLKIPGMLVCTDHIDKVGTNRESHPEKPGGEVTFILHFFRNRDTSTYQDHNSSMFLFGVTRADANPVWGFVFRIMHPFGSLAVAQDYTWSCPESGAVLHTGLHPVPQHSNRKHEGLSWLHGEGDVVHPYWCVALLFVVEL